MRSIQELNIPETMRKLKSDITFFLLPELKNDFKNHHPKRTYQITESCRGFAFLYILQWGFDLIDHSCIVREEILNTADELDNKKGGIRLQCRI